MSERILYRQIHARDIRAARLWARFASGPIVTQPYVDQPTYSCPWCWHDLVVGVPAGQVFDAFGAVRCGCGGWSEVPSQSLEGMPAFQCDLERNRSSMRALYRYLPSEEYFNAFLQGRIWISTIDTCRNTEDPLRVDAGEASQTYNISRFDGDWDDKEMQIVAARLGYEVPPGARNITMAYNTTVTRMPNFHLLCASTSFSPHLLAKFGQFCIRINQPATLLERIGLALGAGIWKGELRGVRYGERTFVDLQTAPDDIGYLKPLKYYREAESRFSWYSTQNVVEPREVQISVSASDFTVMNTNQVDRSLRFDLSIPSYAAKRSPFSFDFFSPVGRANWNRFATRSRPLSSGIF